MRTRTGPAAFGRAYQTMLERDAHARGSVDRVLTSSMIRLCDATAEHLYASFTPLDVRYRQGSRPELEAILRSVCSRQDDPDAQVAAIVRFTSGLGDGAEHDPGRMRLGGTEEAIAQRRSDWCTDVARVACVLTQVAGLPCRLAFLFDLQRAYKGHVIVEAHRAGHWGALDATTGVIYTAADGRPASVWHLMHHPDLIDRHGQATGAPYSTRDQFSAAGIANYAVWERERYDYTVSGINDYGRSILSMAGAGWPGGIRWLHSEDEGGDLAPD